MIFNNKNNSFPKQRLKKSVGIKFTLKELKLKNLNVRLEIVKNFHLIKINIFSGILQEMKN